MFFFACVRYALKEMLFLLVSGMLDLISVFLRVSGMLEKKWVFCVCHVCLIRNAFFCVCQVCLKSIFLCVYKVCLKRYFCNKKACLELFVPFLSLSLRKS